MNNGYFLHSNQLSHTTCVLTCMYPHISGLDDRPRANRQKYWCSIQEKTRIFKSSLCYSRFLIHFSIHKHLSILWLRIPVLHSKQVILIRSTLTYLRCVAEQTRSKYDQPTLYHRQPCCSHAQNTTCGE